MERCGLCLQDRILRKSHLMPKSLYKALRSKDGIVSASTIEGSKYTDRQVTARLLCDDCEEMFSQKGERIVCRECYRGSEGFILRDKLKATSEMFTKGGKGWLIPQRESKNVKLNYEAYRYFGTSVIWRASAGRWPNYAGRLRGCLGGYEEKIRKYLIGETDFPEKVFLLVVVNNDEGEKSMSFNSIMCFPFYEKLEGHHKHLFYIPGVLFVFIIGRKSGEKEEVFRKANTSILFLEESFKEIGFPRSWPRKMLRPKGRLAKEAGHLIPDVF